jgi:hypothetical protein
MNEKRRNSDTIKGQVKFHWPAIALAVTLGLAIFGGATQMGSADQKIIGNSQRTADNQMAIRKLLETQNRINANQQQLNGRLIQGQASIQSGLKEIKSDIRELRRPR